MQYPVYFTLKRVSGLRISTKFRLCHFYHSRYKCFFFTIIGFEITISFLKTSTKSWCCCMGVSYSPSKKTAPFWNILFHILVCIYLFKVNNGNTRTMCEVCSKLTIKTPEWRLRCSGFFIINFEHISHLVLVFLSLTLSR